MKRFFLLLTSFLIITNAQAGFYSSNYFEPTVLCAVGAASEMMKTESDSSKAGMLCAGGIVAGILLNRYMRKKIDIVNENKINELKDEIQKRQVIQAQKANLGVIDDFYSLEAQQVEEAKQLPDGSIISPTIKTMLIKP